MAPSKDSCLSLEYVYGYNGSISRDNLFYNADGNAVFHVAALGIVHNIKNNSQSNYFFFFLLDFSKNNLIKIFHIFFFFSELGFMRGRHTDDIVSLSLHPEGVIVASGEVGKAPKIVKKKNYLLNKIIN